MDTVVGMIDRQRQDQEIMLRGIAAGMCLLLKKYTGTQNVPELSNDIRGERLRFVEAMKEATAINVQCKYFFTIKITDNANLVN